jgi:phage shock protein A
MEGEPEKRIDDLSGMDFAGAKEYLAGFISTRTLTEKRLAGLGEDRKRWEERAGLARSRGAADLAAAAEQEVLKIREQETALAEELAGLEGQIARMKGQLPGLAARERSVDPDLLAEELLFASGRLPGEGERVKTERALADLEKEAAAASALEALKAKLNRAAP